MGKWRRKKKTASAKEKDRQEARAAARRAAEPETEKETSGRSGVRAELGQETLTVALGFFLTWNVVWKGCTRWLHRWYLVGPDTLYIRYGFLSDCFLLVLFLAYLLLFTLVFQVLLEALFNRESRQKAWRGLSALLRPGPARVWRTLWQTLLAHAALLAIVLAPTLLMLVLCLSRTEITTAGTATYFLGFRTSSHSFEELAETEIGIRRHQNRGGSRYYRVAYTLRFRDGYELETEMDFCQGFVQDWISLVELNNTVRDLAPQKRNTLHLGEALNWGPAWKYLRANGF